MAQFHALTISQIERQTAEAVAITFSIPAELAASYHAIPGQYLTLKTTLAGEELRRCYSICNAEPLIKADTSQPAPTKNQQLQVAVKMVPNGRFSNYANQQLQVGDQLEVMTPQGLFCYAPSANTTGNYLAIAAGSGITPLISIISTTLATEQESKFTLIYANRNLASMMFRQTLADLKDRYPARLQLVHIFSQEAVESPLLSGRLDSERIEALGQQLLHWRQFDHVFLCGPEKMMDDIEQTLIAANLAPSKLHRERFLSEESSKTQRPVRTASGSIQQVSIRLDGRQFTIAVNAEDDNILDAALRQGADLPYACKGGVCATCRCRVVSGEVSMGTNYSLEQDQLDAGYILSCQSLPNSDNVQLDFDS